MAWSSMLSKSCSHRPSFDTSHLVLYFPPSLHSSTLCCSSAPPHPRSFHLSSSHCRCGNNLILTLPTPPPCQLRGSISIYGVYAEGAGTAAANAVGSSSPLSVESNFGNDSRHRYDGPLSSQAGNSLLGSQSPPNEGPLRSHGGNSLLSSPPLPNGALNQLAPPVNGGLNASTTSVDSEDLSAQIYASNSMEGWVTPPPPPPPFGGPFEEYYGEIIGENFIEVTESNSLIDFLETLKDKKPAEESITRKRRSLSSVKRPISMMNRNRVVANPLYSQSQPLGEQSRAIDQGPLFPRSMPSSQTNGTGFSTWQNSIGAQGFADSTSLPSESQGKERGYDPKQGDIALGVVASTEDRKLTLEIGAEKFGLMTVKDLKNTFQTDLSKQFFDLPLSAEGFVAPLGHSFLVQDQNSPLTSSECPDVGTVLIGEVQNKTLLGGKAIILGSIPPKKLAWHRLRQLMQIGETVQFEVLEVNHGGLEGYLQGLRAFLPLSELLQRPRSTASAREYVGRFLPVVIIEANENASKLTVSEVKAWMRKNLLLGSVHDVVVTSVTSHGVQVEVLGTSVRGFVHISSMSQEFVRSVGSVFRVGEKARVMLVRSQDPRQLCFSIAELESERGLVLRDKQRVFQEAEVMAKRFCESQWLSEQERQLYGQPMIRTDLEFQLFNVANIEWLH